MISSSAVKENNLLEKQENITSGDIYRDRFFNSFLSNASGIPKTDQDSVAVKPVKFSFSDQYTVMDTIGEGSNAIVKLVVENKTGVKLAMKSFRGKSNWPSADDEAKILSNLNHKNIIKFKKVIKTSTTVILSLERCI